MPYLCVFCGSNSGKNQLFQQQANELGRQMVLEGYDLVYGGASVGLMGAVADSVLKSGGKVTGVIPQALVEKEVAHHHLTELKVVNTMHERKKIMYDLSAAFFVFPGGFGTLDETFEIVTWAQIGLHSKKVILLNIDGFFDKLIAFVQEAGSAGFIKPEHQKLLLTANNIEEAFDLL